jgi:flagellar protein FliL
MASSEKSRAILSKRRAICNYTGRFLQASEIQLKCRPAFAIFTRQNLPIGIDRCSPVNLSLTVVCHSDSMSSHPPSPKADATAEALPKKGGKRKLIIMVAVPVVLLVAGAGLWFSGILPHALGMNKHDEHAEEAAKPLPPPTYVDVPEMVANLNSTNRKPSYVKLSARIEVPKPEDAEKVKAALPRLQDMMQTYLREMRPEELRGSAGTYRLREELLVRANAAVAPAKVSDVLFTQMLVQ